MTAASCQWLIFYCILRTCSCYPNLASPLDETERSGQLVDVLMQSYVEAVNEQLQPAYKGPPGVEPDHFEQDESSSGVMEFSSSAYDASVTLQPPTLLSQGQFKYTQLTNALSGDFNASNGQNEEAADSDSLALVKSTGGQGVAPLHPASLTLTLAIVLSVVLLTSMVGLIAFALWQYRRRHHSSQWVVGKSKLPAYQGDAWCYENHSGGTQGRGSSKRDSVYLAGATIKPYAADTLPTSNGTSRSSVLSESELRRPNSAALSYYDTGRSWRTCDELLHGRCAPYREKLVN